MRHADARSVESPANTQAHQAADQARHAAYRAKLWKDFLNAAFNYDTSLDYELNPKLHIGSMTFSCTHCGAKKWLKK